ncbi:MAG: extracellular solute-binding protein [Bacillota bacterium]
MTKKKSSSILIVTILFLTSFLMFGNNVHLKAQESDNLYENSEIRVLVWRDAHTEAVKKKVSEFEDKTGIKVTIDDLPTQSLTEKMAMNLTSETGKYDLVAVDEPYVPKFASFFINYNEWPEPKVIEEKVDLDIVPEGAVKAGSWQNEVKGLPINANVYMFAYRKDLINDEDNKKAFKEEYGYELQQPKTLEQLHEIGEFFYNNNEIYGYAPFTVKSEGATVEFMWLLKSFGTDILNSDLEVVLNVDKAVEALDYYSKLLEVAPPSKLSMGHPETIRNMEMGQLFSTLQWPAIIAGHENPEKSEVAGDLAYGTNPEGPGGSAAITGVWTLAIPESSNNKQAAAEFAYWWGSKESGRDLVEAGMSPMRTDLLTDPDLQAKYPWYEALLKNLNGDVAVHRPRFAQYPRVSDEISNYFSKVISDEMEAREAMIELKENIENIVEEYKNE